MRTFQPEKLAAQDAFCQAHGGWYQNGDPSVPMFAGATTQIAGLDSYETACRPTVPAGDAYRLRLCMETAIYKAMGDAFSKIPGMSLASQVCGSTGNCTEFIRLVKQYVMFIDANGNITYIERTDPMLRSCGYLVVRNMISPISLVWNDHKKIEDVLSFTQFPLNPEQNGSWYSWRASKDTPLLVHDKLHTGKIVSADQLFGERTFGRSWNNGYEALASLDTNGDKKLTEHELDELALWFDENQDGVSDEGEVRRVTSEGITTLYVTPDDRAKATTKDIVASHGFDMTFDGKTTHGASVDWYAQSYKSRFEAINDQSLRSTAKKTALRSTGSTAGSNQSTSLADSRGPLDGVWHFVIEGARDNISPTGLLLIGQSGSRIIGSALVETPVRNGPKGGSSVLTRAPLSGEASVGKNGRSRAQFTVVDPFSGTETLSEVSLSEDGETLEGFSAVPLTEPKNGEPAQVFRYSWKATRKQIERSPT